MQKFLISWVPKVGALIILAGGGLTTGGEFFWGSILANIGAVLIGLSARQDGKSSEQVGAGVVAPVYSSSPTSRRS